MNFKFDSGGRLSSLTSRSLHSAPFRGVFSCPIARLKDRSRKTAVLFIAESVLGFHARYTMMRWMPRRLLGRYILDAVRSEVLVAATVSNGGILRDHEVALWSGLDVIDRLR